MFSESSTVLSSDQEKKYDEPDPIFKRSIRKYILWGALILAVIVLVASIILIVKKINEKKENNPVVIQEPKPEDKAPVILPNLEVTSDATSTTDSLPLTDVAIEYLSFTEFYQKPDNNIDLSFKDYELPINIKMDGMNYYDLSRKLNLEPVINDINKQGFAIIENPWKTSKDFYSVYSSLEEKQIPFLITSDFITYYYQNVTKKIFKDIEENIFYDNLWLINKELYTLAKNRYETRLASIGEINDSILEGQRLEMAFFAVSLELLKPAPEQVSTGTIDSGNKFNDVDVEKFHLTVPPYLKEDVARELSLIRAAKGTIKSPTLLYQKDYSEFIVPKEYKVDAKLNNFYLASKWINSVFPLEYRTEKCPDCLLDKEDWRLSMIASSYIASDFSERPDLKNRWAKIYKLMSFFSGLREELDYVDYRDSLTKLFGKDYNIENIFDDRNKDAKNNLDLLKKELLKFEYSAIKGAIDKSDPTLKKKIGFKMLTEAYWPNNYLFGTLTSPAIGAYQGTSTKISDITVCDSKRVIARCNGFSLDIANLISPMDGNSLFEKNTQYANYKMNSENLKDQLTKDALWHTSNYWSTLSLMQSILNYNSKEMPIFAASDLWKEKSLETAVSAWINLQLPLDKFSLTPVFKGQSLNSFSKYNENVYIEPNLALINELIATNSMLMQMFTALRLNEELSSASQYLHVIDNDLKNLKEIVIKELTDQPLDERDSEVITDFARKFTIDPLDEKNVLLIPFPNTKIILREDISNIKLMLLVHQSEGNKVISVGPIWDYQEGR